MTEKEFDLIVFGASGFTGQFVVEEVARTAAKDPIKWAISGRSRQKLADVLTAATKETGIELKGIPTIEADITSEESIKAMTKRTRLVLNCVGPYHLYGEPVVKCCVETSTHHLDISGEPQFLEGMQLKYNKEAKEKGVYIIGCCGWDSIPVDLGVQYLKKHFGGELNSVETYLTTKNGPNGPKINIGTFRSIISSIPKFFETQDIHRRLLAEVFTKRAPESKFPLNLKVVPFRNEYVKGWSIPFPGCDRSVVQRTQQFKYEERNERPTQIQTYCSFSLFPLIGLSIVVPILGLLSLFGWGRRLLETYPEFFTFGIFRKEGPTREDLKGASFRTVIIGKGWAERLTEPTDEPSFPPNKTVVVEVKGGDPGYTVTSACLVHSGFTLLRESENIPQNGGVLTPGAAFDCTGIYDRLRERDVIFQVIK